LVKTIRLVAEQSRRAPDDLVVAEGLRVVEEAVRTGHTINAVLVGEEFGGGVRDGVLLESMERAGLHISRAARSVFRSVSDTVTPQGILALVKVPRRRLTDMHMTPEPILLFACGIQDPGNLGSLIRSAAAAGAAFLGTTHGTVSMRNPKCVRSTAGALFRIPVLEDMTATQILEYCAAKGIRLYRTASGAGIDFTSADLRAPAGILLGNEAKGLIPSDWAAIPALRIPMADGVESLNVAAAGAILLFEARRQRLGEAGVQLHSASDWRRS
jgi:TrmH family RNA methyltransferase